MVGRTSTDHLLDDTNIRQYVHVEECYSDVGEASNLETRKQIERRLLRKLDWRVSFLLLAYIMNNVSFISVHILQAYAKPTEDEQE